MHPSLTPSPSHWLNLTNLQLPTKDELQELEGVPGLAVLPVPAHHRHLCPGALGKVYIQLHPLLRHSYGDLHVIRLCAHTREPRSGVLLWDLWRPAEEHHGTHELEEAGGWAWVPEKCPTPQLVLSSPSTLVPKFILNTSHQSFQLIKTENVKLLMECSGNQIPTIFFTSQALWTYPMVLDTQLYVAFTPLLWIVSQNVVCPFLFFSPCPVWVHPTSGFCMMGSCIGGTFACSSHYKILLDPFLCHFQLAALKGIFQQFNLSRPWIWVHCINKVIVKAA